MQSADYCYMKKRTSNNFFLETPIVKDNTVTILPKFSDFARFVLLMAYGKLFQDNKMVQ